MSRLTNEKKATDKKIEHSKIRIQPASTNICSYVPLLWFTEVVVTSASVKPAPPAARDAPLSAALFNVGGQTFQVAAKLIRSKPETLLAKLFAKALDPTKVLHVPVDICPERFRILLDFYRYGEIWVPNTVATKAVLRDAARGLAEGLKGNRFRLPGVLAAKGHNEKV